MAGTGMVPADATPYTLRRATGTLAEAAAKLSGEIGAVTPATVLAHANRTGSRRGAAAALGAMQPRPAEWYAFDAKDQDTVDWYPQGLTCGEDSGSAGAPVLAVTWYFKPAPPVLERGVRLTFLSPQTLKYQHALLVEPRTDGSYAPINIHAGGVAWHGDLLYVADTTRGLRVFDMRHVLDLRSAQSDLGDPTQVGRRDGRFHAFGYRYVIPQCDFWRVAQPGPLFSFVSIDRGTSPHTLISGEYDENGPGGRVVRWDLGPDLGGTPRDAFVLGHPKIQGAVSSGGAWYLSQAADASTNGKLLVYRDGRLTTRSLPIGPEDLSVRGKQVWSVTEFRNKRIVFGVPL
ncbi:hypothetical protein [Nonomuraea roseoviolacea]|uniref:Secreted protein n=1 Tax=Nonomuraea roseoviolacea subsp. carminata TaxID=160689 RepID=A0ABT1K8R0_9ACTN|nr:hypothetical protein [Nonomuraea roseoviolacea]MCP2350385.1 hypothetical protein [Nonomuraea roseoviolacea subsp. carminata]